MPMPKPKKSGETTNLVVKATRQGTPDVIAKDLVPLVKLERVMNTKGLTEGGLKNLTDEQRENIARLMEQK